MKGRYKRMRKERVLKGLKRDCFFGEDKEE